jgi:hypothetical protein
MKEIIRIFIAILLIIFFKKIVKFFLMLFKITPYDNESKNPLFMYFKKKNSPNLQFKPDENYDNVHPLILFGDCMKRFCPNKQHP